MVGDGGFTDKESFTDLLVFQTLTDQGDDFALSDLSEIRSSSLQDRLTPAY